MALGALQRRALGVGLVWNRGAERLTNLSEWVQPVCPLSATPGAPDEECWMGQCVDYIGTAAKIGIWRVVRCWYSA